MKQLLFPHKSLSQSITEWTKVDRMTLKWTKWTEMDRMNQNRLKWTKVDRSKSKCYANVTQ